MITSDDRRALPEWLWAPVVPSPLAKELRAMFLVWLVALGLALPLLFSTHLDDGGGVVSGCFILACALLGAVPLGHEFTHRTLGLLLTQPMARGRLWGRKMAVLGLALLPLVAIVLLPVFGPGSLFEQRLWLLLPVLCAFCAGPWLTLHTRNAVTGFVLSLGYPAALGACSQLATLARFGQDELNSEPARSFMVTVFLASLAVYCVLGLVGGYRSFMRFEAIEAQPSPLALPVWIEARLERLAERLMPRLQGLTAQLVRKELRLQQGIYPLAGLCLLAWLGHVVVAVFYPTEAWREFSIELVFYGLLVAILAGALSCAEERSLGVLEWHHTLPVSARRQWLIKVGVALSLSLVFALCLPVLLLSLPPFEVIPWRSLFADKRVPAIYVMAVLSITSVAVFASALTGNALRAVLVLVGLGAALLAGAGGWVLLEAILRNGGLFGGDRFEPLGESRLALLSVVGFGGQGLWLGLVLYWAFRHHHGGGLAAGWAWFHAACLVFFMGLLAFLLALLVRVSVVPGW